ncbi:MAG: class I adenylate-forming enzyme family protein [Casimicrobiaceae bacterium]
MQRPLAPSMLLERYSRDYRVRRRQIEDEPLPSSVGALLQEAAADVPDATALQFIDGAEGVTYRELLVRVQGVAGGLARIGVRKGTHVGVMLPNVLAFPVTWLALARLGAVMVPINVQFTKREFDYVVRDADVEFLVIDERHLGLLEPGEEAVPAVDHARVIVHGGASAGRHGWDSLQQAGVASPAMFPSVSLDDPLNIQYTSGTTGFPKGCVLTHRYWIVQGKNNATRDGVVYERILASTPFYYMDPQWLLLMAFYQRATLYVAQRQSTSRYPGWLRTWGIHFSLMPAEAVLREPCAPDDGDNLVRRVNIYGLRREVHVEVERRFHVNAREAYGMTELGSALFVPLEADDMVGSGSCGIPVPFRECKVVDGEGRAVADGETGELVVRGAGTLRGYYGKPDATREAFFGDWFRTGDLFRRDASGYFHIVGRVKEMIRRSSENIPAREVEMVLRAMPGIAEAAALPVPDELRKEEVKAYVILQPGLTRAEVPPEAIIAHAQRHLAPFKVPRYLEYREELPRTASGKIRKPELVAEKADLRAQSWDRVDGVWR